MGDNINILAHNLNLSPYQVSKLKMHSHKYNMGRLEKRGGVLYAPYATHGVVGFFIKVLFGVRADLIGQNKTLLQAQKNIRFFANGYHSVRVGKYTYYADADGRNVSRDDFMRGKIN